ncbi:hypothetical protein [Angustibacter luteus]|uniref:XRE family transcriptional regulator n=1 Tax=Angustibacter luteus TaxID=658456 RepID=A0ABW1JEA2_9ACTN
MTDQDRRDDLAHLLERGPFHEALATAVEHRGLTLQRLQHRLTERGATVSVPTLSCWVRGTRRPERPVSMAALAELELVLGLEARSLSDLLGQKRRRGRDAARPVDDETIWRDSASLSAVLSELDLVKPDLRVVSAHLRQRVDGRRVERTARHLNVVEAMRDDLTRTRLTMARLTGRPDQLHVEAIAGVSVGRQRATSDGFVVTELVLDTTLAKGERTVVEYEAHLDPEGEPSINCTALFYRPVRMCVVEVFFDPEQVPVRSFALRKPAGKHEQRSPVRVSAAGVLRSVVFDQPAGEYGLTWDWD